MPALYSSAFQCGYSPKNIIELNKLLRYEPGFQKKYFTIIPVINDGKIDLSKNKYSIRLTLSFYCQDSLGELGENLFMEEIECSGKFLHYPPTDDDVLAQYERVKQRLASSDRWSEIVEYIKTNSEPFRRKHSRRNSISIIFLK
jgi:hypothetical protein